MNTTFFKNVLSTFYFKCAWEVFINYAICVIGSLHIWIKRFVINGFQCLQKIFTNPGLSFLMFGFSKSIPNAIKRISIEA